jgi:hypothetical protein
MKLKVQHHERDQIARPPLAASGEKENPSPPDGARGTHCISLWRRRESNP